MKHTKGPWRVEGYESYQIIAPNGNWICQLWNKNEDDFFNAKANAEFIVRACNSHDELLEALKQVLVSLKVHDESGFWPKDEPPIGIVEQAIAKAEGKESL